MNLAELNKVARAMVAPGRGILAADESSGTIKKRFDAIGVECTADSRRDYREMLFRSTDAMSKYISGVILYDETIRQNAKDGTPLVKLIEQAGSLPGIKVDKRRQAAAVLPGRGRSPKASTACASASTSTASSARNSPSGARSSTSAPACRATPASAPTPTRSRAMPRSARSKASCRSSSPRC